MSDGVPHAEWLIPESLTEYGEKKKECAFTFCRTRSSSGVALAATRASAAMATAILICRTALFVGAERTNEFGGAVAMAVEFLFHTIASSSG